MKSFLFSITAVLFTAVFFFLLTGCTDLERNGISPLPQSRPASWQMQPYGPVRN